MQNLPPLESGQIVGAFSLDRRLGSGRCGELWLANKPSGETAVLKFFGLDPATDQSVISMLSWQAAVQNQVQAGCGHTVAVLEISRGSETCRPYIAVAYVEGESLKQRLTRRGKLSPAEAVPVLRQLFTALGHAHRLQHLHGDVKASNVLLDLQGNAYPIEIEYRSPEEFSGQPASDRSDMFAVGCVAVEMLTGRKPSDSPLSLREWNPAVPPELEVIVSRLTSSHPLGRYLSCSEVLAALEHVERISKSGAGNEPTRRLAVAAVGLALTAFSLFALRETSGRVMALNVESADAAPFGGR